MLSFYLNLHIIFTFFHPNHIFFIPPPPSAGSNLKIYTPELTPALFILKIGGGYLCSTGTLCMKAPVILIIYFIPNMNHITKSSDAYLIIKYTGIIFVSLLIAKLLCNSKSVRPSVCFDTQHLNLNSLLDQPSILFT